MLGLAYTGESNGLSALCSRSVSTAQIPPGRRQIAPARTPASQKRSPRLMLTIYGQKDRYCEGVSRRSFLKIGGLGVGAGALSLTDLFRLEARANGTPS